MAGKTRKEIKNNKPELRDTTAHDSAEHKRFFILASFTLVGASLLQLLLAASYLVAFHAPKPHGLPVGVVSESADVQQIARSLDEQSGGAFKAEVMASKDEAIKQLKTQRIYGVYAPSSPKSEITVASANGKSVSQSVVSSLETFDEAFQKQARATLSATQQGNPAAKTPIEQAAVHDEAPLANQDGGASMFYIAFSAVFGGYLAAVALNLVRGKRAFTKRNVAIRTAGFAVAGIVTSVITSLVAVHGVEAVPSSSFWPIVGILSVTYFGVAMLSSAFISLLGIAGVALAIILFVIVGNPASGGVIPVVLTDNGPWHWLEALLPTGAAVGAIRQAAYFDGIDLVKHILVPVVYVLIGLAALLAISKNKSSISVYEEEIAAEIVDKRDRKSRKS